MPTATFTNTARRGFRPDKSWTWGECWQGQYKGGNCGGYLLFDFSALGNLANISISAIRMTFSVGAVGGSYTKYLYLHVNGYNGAGAGSYKFTQLYNTTRSLAFSAGSNAAGFAVLRDYILGGGTTIGIGASGSRGKQDGKDFDYDYLSLTGMTLEITYEYLKSEGSVGAAQTGGSATMAITAYNSAYSHRVTWRLGDWSATQDVAAGTASASCQIPHSALPNAVSGTATAELETLNGGTSLGSNVYSFPVTVPAGVVPAIGSLTVSPVNAGASSTAAGWGLFIQDRTLASAAMGGVSAGSGASIAAYSLTTSPDYGGAAAASLTTGLLSAAGTVTFTAVVTDSRGRTATATATITVQAYAPPQITGTPSVYRCTSDGTRDDTGGTYAKLTAGFSFSGVNGQNSLTVRRVALNGANTDLTSGAAAVIGAGGLSPDNTYQAVITLTDAVGSTTTYTVAIPSAAYLMHFAEGGRSIGIGCAANSTPDDTVHVGWNVDLTHPLSVVSGGTNAKTPLQAIRNLGGMVELGYVDVNFLNDMTVPYNYSAVFVNDLSTNNHIDIPVASWFYVQHYSKSDGDGWAHQIFYEMGGSARIFHRISNHDTWYNSIEIPSASGWGTLDGVTWNKTFITNTAIYQNHTVMIQMTLASNGAVSGDVLAVLPTNAKCRVHAPIVYADGSSNALGGSGMVYIEGGSKNIIVSKASVPANSYMNISMVIPVE